VIRLRALAAAALAEEAAESAPLAEPAAVHPSPVPLPAAPLAAFERDDILVDREAGLIARNPQAGERPHRDGPAPRALRADTAIMDSAKGLQS